jgi:hypothetical protein
MTLLPTITWGGQEFYDISGIVRLDTAMGGIRPVTDGIAVHHSVGQTDFPDHNANGTSLDEMIAHIKAIDAFHVQQGYGGFGYNAIAFRDGTVCTVGRAAGQRAHVAFENWHLTGIVGAGDFSNSPMPVGMYLGMARFCAAVEKEYGVTNIKGHRQWVNLVAHPTWGTACPGDAGLLSIGNIILAKQAIIAQQNSALDAAVRQKIAEVLMPTAAKGDLQTLAAQIRFITGGTLCG